MACIKEFKVSVISPGSGSRDVIIEAVNVPEARRFAEGRYPGTRIGAVRTA